MRYDTGALLAAAAAGPFDNMTRLALVALAVVSTLCAAQVARAQSSQEPAEASPPAETSKPTTPRRLAIIVHRSNNVPAMAEKEVRGIFTVERRFWFGTEPLRLVIREKGQDVHAAFAERVLGKSVDALDAFYGKKRELWKDLKVAASDEEAKNLVKRDKGAVAYVWEDAVDASVRQVASIPLDVSPEEDSVDAGVARLTDTMDNLRDLWDQLQASLRSPGVPDEDLVKMAEAVASFCEDVHRRAPQAKDPPSKKMNRLAAQLMQETSKLPGLVSKRQQAIKAMGRIEKNTCMGCHREFR